LAIVFNVLPLQEITTVLQEKVKAVEEVFSKLDQEIASFQSWSTLHCKAGCGKCCFKADIEATALEFLPFAHYLYEKDLAFQWLDGLKSAASSQCLILNPTQSGAGLCSEYPYRGLICRLFGYSARTNKYGAKELVTCQVIKTEQAEAYGVAKDKVENNETVPIMNQYYMQLHAIDPELARDFYPINEAIKRAIETVLHYYAYRN
jgi:Fe-S-cluster containining protein